MRKSLTKIGWKSECWAMQKCVNIIDLVKSFQTSSYLQKFGFDTAENEPLKVCQKIAKVRITVRKNIGEGLQREAVRGGRLRIGDLLSDGPQGDSARARHRVGQLQQGRLRRRLGSVQEGRQSSSRPVLTGRDARLRALREGLLAKCRLRRNWYRSLPIPTDPYRSLGIPESSVKAPWKLRNLVHI
jgi:hypothetical protein